VLKMGLSASPRVVRDAQRLECGDRSHRPMSSS
jgi:hypothetical protein